MQVSRVEDDRPEPGVDGRERVGRPDGEHGRVRRDRAQEAAQHERVRQQVQKRKKHRRRLLDAAQTDERPLGWRKQLALLYINPVLEQHGKP